MDYLSFSNRIHRPSLLDYSLDENNKTYHVHIGCKLVFRALGMEEVENPSPRKPMFDRYCNIKTSVAENALNRWKCNSCSHFISIAESPRKSDVSCLDWKMLFPGRRCNVVSKVIIFYVHFSLRLYEDDVRTSSSPRMYLFKTGEASFFRHMKILLVH